MMWEENARTTPIQFAAPPPPEITCEMLKRLAAPTLLLEGRKLEFITGSSMTGSQNAFPVRAVSS